MIAGRFNGFFACSRFGNHPEMSLTFQQRPQPGTYHRMIICNENTNSPGHTFSGPSMICVT